jgi:chromosomal replication initiation ATPase DnaA
MNAYTMDTGASLASLVNEVFLLNQKQRMVVGRVLSQVLASADHPFDSSQRKQTLLYVGGEGGTGKSQMIKAIVDGMFLVERKDEIVLMAPTGAAGLSVAIRTIHLPSTVRVKPR